MADDAAAVAAAAAAAAAAKPWFQGVAGFDAEYIGHLQNRGWDKKTAPEAAFEALKSFKEAEKRLGAPADELVRVPKDPADENGWKAVWTRLGMPADAKGYDFADIKYGDGKPLDEEFANSIRAAAFGAHLPKDAASTVTRAVVKFLEAEDAKEAAARTQTLAEQKLALSKNWGKNEAAFKFVAQQAVAALGVDPAAVSALEGVIGYDKVMDLFLKIGQKTGEDKFITGAAGGQSGAMTREQAIAKRGELMSNVEWAKSYTSGDKEKLREMMGLNSIITGIAQAA